MTEQTVIIKNVAGLQVKLAGKLSGEAKKYVSTVRFRHKNSEYNAKSFLSVLGAAIRFGDEVTFVCEGEDEEMALHGMTALADEGFGE